MKKITFLSSLLAISLFSFAQTTVLKDFTSNSVGDSYPIYGLYQNAVSTTRGTATVAADPAGTNGNSVKVVPISGNHLVQFTITIPSGKTLANYDNFYFDLYPTNILNDGITAGQTGARYSTALVQIGSSCTPTAAGATALLYETASVDKGSSNTWHTIAVDLTKLTGLSAYSGSQSLFIGLYSNNNTIYYLDNIVIHATTTGLTNATASKPLVIFSDRNTLKFNQTVDNAELFSLSGSRIMSVTNTNQISVSNLNNGVYVVKSIIAGETYTSKIIK
jgi:hypothetical protein